MATVDEPTDRTVEEAIARVKRMIAEIETNYIRMANIYETGLRKLFNLTSLATVFQVGMALLCVKATTPWWRCYYFIFFAAFTCIQALCGFRFMTHLREWKTRSREMKFAIRQLQDRLAAPKGQM